MNLVLITGTMRAGSYVLCEMLEETSFSYSFNSYLLGPSRSVAGPEDIRFWKGQGFDLNGISFDEFADMLPRMFEKIPNIFLRAEKLESWEKQVPKLPVAPKIVMVGRHPCDMYVSLRRYYSYYGLWQDVAENMTVADITHCFQRNFRIQMHLSDLHEFVMAKYEDLCVEDPVTIRRVESFVGYSPKQRKRIVLKEVSGHGYREGYLDKDVIYTEPPGMW